MDRSTAKSSLIVVPCLNEAAHIEALVEKLRPSLEPLRAKIVIADGGSTDGTREIARRLAAEDSRVLLLDNPQRIQSAAVNRVVTEFGSGFDFLIRIDAHASYPEDYCETLVDEALAMGADSVVVAMETVGLSTFQKATALAQNSKLGNGGSRHRTGAAGQWVEHGHHALMRIAAFKAIGGYDETFSHNEDAEFDYRLRKAGYRIWMTDSTSMVYYPRTRIGPLFRQYFAYGRGRAKNILKHRAMPGLRQILPLAVAPVAFGALLAIINWTAIIPFGLWAAACLGYGAWIALGQRNPYGPLAAVSAMIMHLAWSAGFWRELLAFRKRVM